MTVSGYRLPQQVQGQAMSQQQQQQEGNNGAISKTDLNRSDSTIFHSSDTPAPSQQQQLGLMASLTNGGGGGRRSNSLSEPTHQRLSASSSNSSTSSSAMIDMWVAANAAIKVETSSQHSNTSISGPGMGAGSISPPTGISTPGSIKGKNIF